MCVWPYHIPPSSKDRGGGVGGACNNISGVGRGRFEFGSHREQSYTISATAAVIAHPIGPRARRLEKVIVFDRSWCGIRMSCLLYPIRERLNDPLPPPPQMLNDSSCLWAERGSKATAPAGCRPWGHTKDNLRHLPIGTTPPPSPPPPGRLELCLQRGRSSIRLPGSRFCTQTSKDGRVMPVRPPYTNYVPFLSCAARAVVRIAPSRI